MWTKIGGKNILDSRTFINNDGREFNLNYCKSPSELVAPF